MRDKYILFTYGGNWFLGRFCHGKREGIELLEVLVRKDKLKLPDWVQDCPVLYMNNPKISRRERVQSLYIPDTLEEYLLPNMIFPFLQKVEVAEGNPVYSSDGLSLYSKDGTRLYLALAGSNQDVFKVPATVQVISKQAFSYAKIKKFLFLNPDVEVEENAFDGTRWQDSFSDHVVMVGNLLYQVRGDVPILDARKKGIKRVHPHAFDLYKPDTLIGFSDLLIDDTKKDAVKDTGELEKDEEGEKSSGKEEEQKPPVKKARRIARIPKKPLTREIEAAEKEKENVSQKEDMDGEDARVLEDASDASKEEVRELEDTSEEDALPTEADSQKVDDSELEKDPILSAIVFSKDKKTLLRFPENLEAEKLVIPLFVLHVSAEAFANQKYLQKVGLAEPVLLVGEGAFHHMSSLEYMRTLAGPKVFPDASEGGYGVFEGCEKLSKIVLGDQVEEIGDRCFKGCPIGDMKLSPVLRRIGQEAFCDATGSITLPKTVETVGKAAFAKMSYVEAYEGSAIGLMDAIFPLEGKRSYPEDIVALTIHRRHEETSIYLRVPLTLKPEGRRLLSSAWNDENEGMSLSLLAKCFSYIENEKEKQGYGLLLLSQFPDSPEMKFIRGELGRVSHLIAQGYLEAGDEDELLELLHLRIINPGKVLGLVNLAKARGLKNAVQALRDYGARETARKQGMI